ncbi:MAG: 2-amino-4-hydroxy-6-hydroxymethyldihydropteridine diphosphokinase, partial [Candidatus Omnitrophica bacterium]|nr:2-amino-4-hydroxy-6-hydroxymethyldihydropteridine diphosphokinase [Candidatus Omnitrophota bacterium]
MATVYLGLGSNLGNRQLNLQRAIRLLNENSIITEKISSFVETNPVGGPKQNKFINAVVKAQTEHSPQKLLILVKSIEKR